MKARGRERRTYLRNKMNLSRTLTQNVKCYKAAHKGIGLHPRVQRRAM
jgi:hypothetical protein